ncbi:hypothetical protein Fmac_008179 [Flemingia macrophylla]|uniref:PGG domain-containing protein n=1 Tax=Flemingia macrophylla TaxID=520843 RepID=A0ABD1MWR6_9FABA
MKRTAQFSMVVSTVIATRVFAAAIKLIPSGTNDEKNKPNYLDKTSFSVFALSDAFAFISSATATLAFLSILVSRYAEYDFHKSLPLKLISGLMLLFISIACMMVAFCSAFFIVYDDGSSLEGESVEVRGKRKLVEHIEEVTSVDSDVEQEVGGVWDEVEEGKGIERNRLGLGHGRGLGLEQGRATAVEGIKDV